MPSSRPKTFKINATLPRLLGRAGTIETPHGQILTPAFVTVGTKATVKSLTPEQVSEARSQVVLANTYHLMLEPGADSVSRGGGLHQYMNWQGPTMTDSGGFQAFSLGLAYGQGIGKFVGSDQPDETTASYIDAELDGKVAPNQAVVTEEGVNFASIIDGSRHLLTPEASMEIQEKIGADIIFALDEFTSPHAIHERVEATVDRTTRWAERSISAHKRTDQALFGIVQGGRYQDLREKSARDIMSIGFEGYGIGGTFIKEDMALGVAMVNSILEPEKPRHLLGVGEPIDIILGTENGCDTFDCVAPTRIARNGQLYTQTGKINIWNSRYRDDLGPIDIECGCYTCRAYSRGYLAHLFRAREMLAATLASIHNLYFLNTLTHNLREAILAGTFHEFKSNFIQRYES